MSLLHDAVTQKKFDVRSLEKNLTRGVVKSDEVEKHLKSLPDDSDNMTTISIAELMSELESDRSKPGR
jgi:hypothetical protein